MKMHIWFQIYVYIFSKVMPLSDLQNHSVNEVAIVFSYKI